MSVKIFVADPGKCRVKNCCNIRASKTRFIRDIAMANAEETEKWKEDTKITLEK